MKSFFDKLTGSNNIDETEDDLIHLERNFEENSLIPQEEEIQDGELAVDVYDGGDEIIIKTMVAGVKPEDLDISITREMLTIRGTRKETNEVSENNYHKKELYWGSFSRTVMLPAEVDIDNAEAVEKHGLLILTLPKIDKERKSKLKIRS
ncbi:MAG: Hsp20/alpha crystallin family protein [Patescibacteria group bacterium]